MSENNEKRCFIITPIGNTGEEIRRATEGLIEAVIIPTLGEMGFKTQNISVAHRISESGSINRQIISRIIEDDLAIVNLTGLNPNVMYELAVRHAVAKPVIMLAEEDTRLPFDIVDQRTIFYRNDMLGTVQLKEDLKTFVNAALGNDKVENPLIQLIQEQNALNNIQEIDKGAAELILNRLDRIERQTSNNLGENYNLKQEKHMRHCFMILDQSDKEKDVEAFIAKLMDVDITQHVVQGLTKEGIEISFNTRLKNVQNIVEMIARENNVTIRRIELMAF